MLFYFMIKIALFGPESTGKTTLARQLAEHFDTIWVEEFARGYLLENGNRFEPQDVQPIAEGQLLAQKTAELRANRLLFLDTDLLTNALYSQWCFGEIPDWLAKMARENRPGLYLFLQTDLPWQPDELRTHGNQRDEQMRLWQWGLENFGGEWVAITGTGEKRLAAAISAVEAVFFVPKN